LFPIGTESGHFSMFENAQLANLGCELAEEAKLLIPSLERLDDYELQSKLDEMKSLRGVN
ncbi:hypothetical protein HDU91_006505, partial [Kappamyces sp. JEL0680]